MEAQFRFGFLALGILIIFFLFVSKFVTAAKTGEQLKNESLLGDARYLIDMLEDEYWKLTPKFDCWENRSREQVDRVLEKFPETVKVKIQKLTSASAEKEIAEKMTPVTRFYKWVYMLVNSMDARASFLRKEHGNFRKMCSFSANIAYARIVLDKYTSHRTIPANSTLELEPIDIQNIQTILNVDLDMDEGTIQDLGLLFAQTPEIRKDCLDKSDKSSDGTL